ncbi:hypothetical protein Nmul_A1756 [Nitrosospira multiformis ATCC 25196]|uniref:Uncharacterized protein n=1 Tax=Nitrosospira multiformis (strain ATCC 25196 / NCIMB 11849 / C 71) TaxID=323848 RepID=Q2Y868_NITMU|nr:hypothetical protein Nmul_A1756 [Nitrosospira multiformis ATCC 25196]
MTRSGFTGAMNIRFLYRSINFPESRRQRLGASAEGGTVPSKGRCDPERVYWRHEYQVSVPLNQFSGIPQAAIGRQRGGWSSAFRRKLRPGACGKPHKRRS